MQILAVCGSLRRASINRALLRAFARLAAPGAHVTVFPSLGTLALFNPDLEAQPPAPVAQFQAAVRAADALVIATPEYAHGISGTLKNALDWLVGFEPFVNKPVAVINASPRAHHADDALREILRTMSAALVGDRSFALALLGAQLDEDGMAASPEVREVVERVVAALALEVSCQGGFAPGDG